MADLRTNRPLTYNLRPPGRVNAGRDARIACARIQIVRIYSCVLQGLP